MTAATTALDLLRTRRVVVCVGPGGVGKTTVAAALGVAAAREGRRTAVLTIDPARRLAGALALDGLDDSLQEVPGAPGLWAAMLDTSSSFDALIRRVAPGDAAAAILANRVYRSFSRTLARSHAYVAFERLHDVFERFDLIVLDTPPTRVALEVLDAPGALVTLLDHGVVEWLVRPRQGALSSLLPSGSAAVGRLLALVASRRLVTELAEFFRVLSDLRPGFRERAARVRALLRSADAAFVLVAAPESTFVDDASHLAEGLSLRGIDVDLLVVNRAEVAAGEPPPDLSAIRSVAARWLDAGEDIDAACDDLTELHRASRRESARRRALGDELADRVGCCARVRVPDLGGDVTSVAALAGFAELLVAAES